MLTAYHGSEAEKQQILTQLRAHRLADELVKGLYWRDGKGCAIGCTLHTADHMEYEKRFGIPVMVAFLEDSIFEGLPNEVALEWPERLMTAIMPGTNLSLVGWQLLHWLLTDVINPSANHPLVCGGMQKCADIVAVLAAGGSVSAGATQLAEDAALLAWETATAAYDAPKPAYYAASAAIYAAQAVNEFADPRRVAMCVTGAASEVVRGAACGADTWVKIADKLVTLVSQAPHNPTPNTGKPICENSREP